MRKGLRGCNEEYTPISDGAQIGHPPYVNRCPLTSSVLVDHYGPAQFMAATVQPATRSHSIYQPNPNPNSVPTQQQRRSPSSKQRFLAEFSQCLVDFVIQLLPTTEELAVKEDVRKLLERLIRTIEPDSRLLSFGSTANGFSLRNSDMDLCCCIDSDERLSASDLVNMLGDLLERETKFHVKPLPHARIPIVKLNLDPSPGLPFGIACDIGFENRLALENTRLLMCYAMIDPARVRTMVLFLKVWSKRRKINSPYQGTLSSYGYVLLVIYFLVHVKNPPVLPNLQQMPPMRPISKEDMYLNGHNIWFFDDIELLRQRWQSSNTETVAELLIDFFKYFSRDFSYNSTVVSIRAGLLKKDSKGWLSESEIGTARERNRFCIEDPFEVDFNVSRCVTKDGLFTIRGEFMRASRVLATRPERAIVALAQLCEERKEDELVRVAALATPFIPPRLSPVPAQTPYTVGSSPIRPSSEIPIVRPVPRTQPSPVSASQPRLSTPPQHMAPKRGKWTSPPPPEAPTEDHSAFEDQLGRSLALATSSVHGREPISTPSSNGSEIFTDDDRSDFAEVDEAGSFTQGSSVSGSPANSSPRFPESSKPRLFDTYSTTLVNLAAPKPAHVAPSRIDMVQRPMTSDKSPFSAPIPFGFAAASHYNQQQPSGLQCSPQPTVFYETAGRIPTIRSSYPGSPCVSTVPAQYDQPPLYHVIVPASAASLPQHVLMARKRNLRKSETYSDGTGSSTPTSSQQFTSPSPGPHSHTQSNVTIKSGGSPSSVSHSPTTPISTVRNIQQANIQSSPSASSSSRSRSPRRFSPTPSSSSSSQYTNTRPPRRNHQQQQQQIQQQQESSLMDDCTPDLTFSSSSSSPPTSTSSGGSGSRGSPESSSVNFSPTRFIGLAGSPRMGMALRGVRRESMGDGNGRASPLMLAALQQQAQAHAAALKQQQQVEFRRAGLVGFGGGRRQERENFGFR